MSSGQSHFQHRAVVWPVDASIQLIFQAAAAATAATAAVMVPCGKGSGANVWVNGPPARLARRANEAGVTRERWQIGRKHDEQFVQLCSQELRLSAAESTRKH